MYVCIKKFRENRGTTFGKMREFLKMLRGQRMWFRTYFTLHQSLWAFTSNAFEGTPLSLILFDWCLVCKSRRLVGETSQV